ncbi:MAG: trypsin-like peptidase domain-containing protein [Clostridiales Family XIII bacterium]|jgi:S1-C subfamily serine protease|nr:trypsin-like peptidase domain-containing protein [Clostridiales Family XIII bacterium]
MDYRDFFNEEQNAGQSAPQAANQNTQQTLDSNVQQTPEQNAAQTSTQNLQQAPEQSAAQTSTQNVQQTPDSNAQQTPTQNTQQTPGRNVQQTPTQGAGAQPPRQRVYGQVSGQGGGFEKNTGYYNAPNPYYQGDAPLRPVPSARNSESSIPAGTNAYGTPSYGTPASSATPSSAIGAQSVQEEPHTRIHAPFTAPHPTAAGAAAPAGIPVKAPFLNNRRFVVLIIIIIAAIIASGVAGGFIGANMSNANPPEVASGVASGSNITITPNAEVNITEAVAQKVLDSVVGITSTVTTEGGNYFGFELGPQESGGVGTGIIVDERGYILTNSHVVLDGSLDKIEVLLSDGSTISGKLLWNDSSIDLAIVKIDITGKTLKPAELGDSDKVRIGQYVAAIGNPLGLDFNGSITQGVVSGLGRSITASDGSKTTSMEGLIQVDAAINSGNSGGPLLDNVGKVIGVNTAKAQAEGMGFAIPINEAKPIIDKVITTGSFERVYMGVSAADASAIAEQYPNLNIDKSVKGAFITAVSGDSPANKAGLKMKDIITKVEGKEITSSTDLIKTLLNYSSGDTVKVTYLRDGKTAVANVKLANQEDVYGEWNNEGTGENAVPESPGGSNQTPTDPYGGESAPTDPFSESDPFENPFGDW